MHPRDRLTGVMLCLLVVALALGALAGAEGDGDPVTGPLQPEYRLNPDNSVTFRLCYNSSCRRTEPLTFSVQDMLAVSEQMALCPGATLQDRLQRVRIAVWQMEVMAEKYQPLLANDLAINDAEFGVEGRTDCVDNATNTTTYLQILSDAGALPGWSVVKARVRRPLNFNLVHWTAAVRDEASGDTWAVDSWFRPNGHLPFVMPIRDWLRERRGWDPPFDKFNPYPRHSYELCRVGAR